MTYMLTITPHFGFARVSAFDLPFGGGNTTGRKIMSVTCERLGRTDEQIVTVYAREWFGSATVRKGDVPSLFIVTV